MTNIPPYDNVSGAIRDDLAIAHGDVLHHLASPGSWLTGKQRIAAAAEARHAENCAFCRARKEALSPNSVAGAHDSGGKLPSPFIDIVHRIVSDPARLSRSWYRAMLANGVSDEEYVEILSVIAHTISLDTFAKALGIARLALPAPRAGAPSRQRPAGAVQGGAWVPWIETAAALPDGMADLYPSDRPAPNIMRAMSLVPSEVRSFFALGAVQYLGPHQVRDFSREFRAITHAQIELLAGRISSLNQCLY